jgi:hypothetical protein
MILTKEKREVNGTKPLRGFFPGGRWPDGSLEFAVYDPNAPCPYRQTGSPNPLSGKAAAPVETAALEALPPAGAESLVSSPAVISGPASQASSDVSSISVSGGRTKGFLIIFQFLEFSSCINTPFVEALRYGHYLESRDGGTMNHETFSFFSFNNSRRADCDAVCTVSFFSSGDYSACGKFPVLWERSAEIRIAALSDRRGDSPVERSPHVPRHHVHLQN